MKKIILLLSLITVCSSPLTTEAFWPFTSKKQKAAPREDNRPLSTQEINYQSHYGDAVREAAAEVYVICADCSRHSELHRALKEIPLAINLGSDSHPTITLPGSSAHQSVPVFSAPVQTAAEKPIEREPGVRAPDCHDTTVYFEFNSSIVSPEEKKKLTEQIPGMKRSDIALAGYTCDIGPKQYNDKLALARAQSVEAVLEEHGVIPVKAYGKGKCCYASKSRPKNRRVEVICNKKQN